MSSPLVKWTLNMSGFWKFFTWLFQSNVSWRYTVSFCVKALKILSVNISILFCLKILPNILYFFHILGFTVLDHSLNILFQFLLQKLQMKVNFLCLVQLLGTWIWTMSSRNSYFLVWILCYLLTNVCENAWEA